MRVAIMGTGNVGQALAVALRRAGHTVIFGARTPDAARADERTVRDAAAAAEIAILAVPFEAAGEVIVAAGGFPGKPLIDATNPLGVADGELSLTLGFETYGAELIVAQAPLAHVVKAFNQTGWENMQDARAYLARPVMFVAGDDDASKAAASTLVADAGFDAIDLGGLRAARLLEPLAMLWIELARKRGLGAEFCLALQRRGAGA